MFAGLLLMLLVGLCFMALAIARDALDDRPDLDERVDAALRKLSLGYPPENRERFLKGTRDIYAEIKGQEVRGYGG